MHTNHAHSAIVTFILRFLGPVREIYGSSHGLQLANLLYLACPFARTTPQFIAFRLLASPSSMFPHKQRGQALAIYSPALLPGSVLRPLYVWSTSIADGVVNIAGSLFFYACKFRSTFSCASLRAISPPTIFVSPVSRPLHIFTINAN